MADCSFTTKKGKPCRNPVKHDGLCVVHLGLKTAVSRTRWEKAKQVGTTVGAFASGAVAVMKLIEEAVKLWSSLPFGPMERESHLISLKRKIGPYYPKMAHGGTARTKGHPDWATAECLYDKARSIIERGAESAEDDSVIDGLTEWLAGLPDWYQQEIAKRIDTQD